MYSYVAFVRTAHTGRIDDPAQDLINRFRDSHPQWSFSDEGKGISLFHLAPRGRSAAAVFLPDGNGVILGTVFPRDLAASPRDWRPVIDKHCAESIVWTRGRHLMEKFWGGYVAFLAGRDGTAHYVLRDCSGKIPCYTIAQGNCTIVAASVEDLRGLPVPRFSINVQYLAGFVYETELTRRECALNEVSELLAGECLELKDGHATQFAMWDPRTISREGIVENFEAAVRQVREVSQSCIDFWASKYDRIVHHLSGGLDSSAVLGCLRRSAYRPQVTCLHMDSGDTGESECSYARLAAEAADAELVVLPGFSENSRYDERIFRLPRAPKPSAAHLGIAIESDLRNLIPSQMRAEATWDGQGGDHLFFDSRSPFAAVDYAFLHGISGDYSRHVRDAVRLSRLSYWSVQLKAIRLGLLRARWHPDDELHKETMFLNPEIRPSNIVDYIWQPWSNDASDLPPGKRWQISLLGRLIHRHRPIPGLQYADSHHPLFSQPLFELCLRIPVHTLLRGGINRAVERAAFRDCVPEPIIQRQAKGSIATTFMSNIRESWPFIRELILDGVLVQERILERSSLEPFLAANRPMNPGALWPFLSCVAAEVWARKWADTAWRL